MRGVDMGSLRDRLDVVVVAATLLLVTLAFGAYLEHRQALGDARAEKQRTAICSILAALPPSPPPSLQAARAVFARPGHPHDCQPVTRPSPTPRPAVTSTATVTPRPQIIVVPGGTSFAPAPRRSTARPTARPSATPTKSASPTPSPTCLDGTGICLPRHG